MKKLMIAATFIPMCAAANINDPDQNLQDILNDAAQNQHNQAQSPQIIHPFNQSGAVTENGEEFYIHILTRREIQDLQDPRISFNKDGAPFDLNTIRQGQAQLTWTGKTTLGNTILCHGEHTGNLGWIAQDGLYAFLHPVNSFSPMPNFECPVELKVRQE